MKQNIGNFTVIIYNFINKKQIMYYYSNSNQKMLKRFDKNKILKGCDLKKVENHSSRATMYSIF